MKITNCPPTDEMPKTVADAIKDVDKVNEALRNAQRHRASIAPDRSTGGLDDIAIKADRDLAADALLADDPDPGTPHQDRLAADRQAAENAVASATDAVDVVCRRALAVLKEHAPDIIAGANTAARSASTDVDAALDQLVDAWRRHTEAIATRAWAERAKAMQPTRGSSLSYIVRDEQIADGALRGRPLGAIISELRTELARRTA